MLKKCFAILMVMFAVANITACTSHPDDRGDVTGRNMQNTPRED